MEKSNFKSVTSVTLLLRRFCGLPVRGPCGVDFQAVAIEFSTPPPALRYPLPRGRSSARGWGVCRHGSGLGPFPGGSGPGLFQCTTYRGVPVPFCPSVPQMDLNCSFGCGAGRGLLGIAVHIRPGDDRRTGFHSHPTSRLGAARGRGGVSGAGSLGRLCLTAWIQSGRRPVAPVFPFGGCSPATSGVWIRRRTALPARRRRLRRWCRCLLRFVPVL